MFAEDTTRRQNRPNMAAPFFQGTIAQCCGRAARFHRGTHVEKCPKHLELSRVLRSHARGHNYGEECVASLISYWNVGIVQPTNDDDDDEDNDYDDWL